MTGKKTVPGRLNYHQLILNQAGKLADLLMQSPEFNQYMTARKNLETDEDNATLMANLREQEMMVQMSSMFEDNEEAVHELEHDFIQMCQVPVINDYLFAEGRLLRLISEVEKVFADRLGLVAEEDEYVPDQQSGAAKWLN